MKEISSDVIGQFAAAGANTARRGAVACRPSHPDWPEHNLAEISRLIVNNPYIRTELGDDARVSVQRSVERPCFVFSVHCREGA